METLLIAHSAPEKLVAVTGKTLLCRLATVAETAEQAAWLLSPRSGPCHRVGGGDRRRVHDRLNQLDDRTVLFTGAGSASRWPGILPCSMPESTRPPSSFLINRDQELPVIAALYASNVSGPA